MASGSSESWHRAMLSLARDVRRLISCGRMVMGLLERLRERRLAKQSCVRVDGTALSDEEERLAVLMACANSSLVQAVCVAAGGACCALEQAARDRVGVQAELPC